jgi:hypothetical protein
LEEAGSGKTGVGSGEGGLDGRNGEGDWRDPTVWHLADESLIFKDLAGPQPRGVVVKTTAPISASVAAVRTTAATIRCRREPKNMV